MTVSTPSVTATIGRLGSEAGLATLLLAGGCLNGFLVRMVESWSLDGLGSITLGISPFELITLAVAIAFSGVREEHAAARLGAPEVLAMGALLVPSSTVAWAMVLLYGAWRAAGTHGPQRAGALLFVGLAASSLWSSIVIKWVALPLTSAEAGVATWLLSFLREGLAHSGNVIGPSEGHTLIVMTACSTAHGLPKAILALVAIAIACGGILPRRLLAAAAILAAVYATANVLRLALMAWSKPMFEIAHGPIGANLFDVLQTGLIFLLATRVGRA